MLTCKKQLENCEMRLKAIAKRIYQHGRDAFKSGISIKDNPWNDTSHEYYVWKNGWIMESYINYKNMSNIQDKTFYKEAEDVQPGWGKYLKSIDKLKDKVDNKVEITLKEACWILYEEGSPSSIWESFYKYCESIKLKRKKMLWECWNGLFQSWYKNNK